jgi:hypothetical protein
MHYCRYVYNTHYTFSVDLVADKVLPFSVKEFEIMNKDIAYVDISLLIGTYFVSSLTCNEESLM